jgi:hypothetical protein
VKTTIASKNIGYELRCADPIPFDIEYTRDLGYCATKYLLEGGTDAMISMQGGHFVPIPFGEMIDPATGRTRVRLADVNSTGYAIARRYMIRLRRDDFDDPRKLARLAATVNRSPEAFRDEFQGLVADEPPPLMLRDGSDRENAPGDRRSLTGPCGSGIRSTGTPRSQVLDGPSSLQSADAPAPRDNEPWKNPRDSAGAGWVADRDRHARRLAAGGRARGRRLELR